jgi:hypothetical protein
LVEDVIDEKGVNIIGDIKVGDRFFTSIDFLERAKSSRVTYGSKK